MAAFTGTTTDSPTTTVEGGSGLTPDWFKITVIAVVVLLFVILLRLLCNRWRPTKVYRRNHFEEKRRYLKKRSSQLEDDDQRHQQEEKLEMTTLLPRPTKETGTPGPYQVGAARKAKEALKKGYTTNGSYVQMHPWVDDNKRHIMDIYTKLQLVEQVDMRGEFQTVENKMISYEEIFHFKTREGNPIKSVVISGSAGIGKTTLIDKIAYDWALGNSETLNKYELVLVLKMRLLEQSSNLMDAIVDQLLGKIFADKSVLEEFIDNNQDKVLILLEGFDEFQTTTFDTSSFGSILKVLNRKQGTECWVVITTRPPLDKLVNSSLVEKPYTHVRVEGFSDTDKDKYVNKFFPEDHDKASKLIEQIQLSDTLSDLAKSPMLLLLMCLLWDAENTLPGTMTRLYKKALKYIFKRKTTDIKDEAISKILISIGKVALDRLISKDQSFAFREGDFETKALDAAMNAGVLTSERVIDGIDSYQRVSFRHHTLLGYCAAMYWQTLIITNKFNRILYQIDIDTESTPLTQHSCLSRYDYLLRFCCGDNETCTNRILQRVHPDKTSLLAIICYFESQSKKLPPENVISSVMTGDIDISDWNNDSTSALFYFLKQVTALSRGNDYFTKVKKLAVAGFNFQKFGEDLAKSIKLMTNLQSLFLRESSLTTAYTKELLSSLASPSTLTELDLSDNPALGGCASKWGPQLGKMECLQNIHLAGCLLKGTDIEPITMALSGVSTLVHLDLTRNNDLGDCASSWALYLKKMKHLKKLVLKYCNLRKQDMEPIAESVSDMSTLVHLNLSENGALGGCEALGDCESSWALQLKKMNHLKELELVACNLIFGDMKPIAESVSDMPNLGHLDLSGNDALGGCASSWALHLKRMNHLEELKLVRCTLRGCDMEPIAESVSDMPNLGHLDLSRNDALGGCASLWASHLKKMMKHLKELKMYRCLLTDEERANYYGLNSPILKT